MKIYKFPLSLSWRRYLIFVLLIISVFYSFSGIFFGLDFTDSFYHLNQALYPTSGIYLYPFFLSSLLIKGIIGLIGTEIIYLRFVNWLLLVASMILPFIFLKANRKKLGIFFFFSIILILYAPLNANILGYDTLSIFFLSLLFSLTVLYLRVKKFYLIIFLALISAAAVLIRLPNVLAIFFVFSFLLVLEGVRKKEWTFNRIKMPGTFAVLSCVFIVLGYVSYYSSWEQFVAATSNAESHDLVLLFSHYLKDALKLAGYSGLLLSGFWGYRKFHVHGFIIIREAVLALFFCFCLIFLVGYTKYSVHYSLFLVALAVAFSFIQIFYERKEKLSNKTMILLLFLFINPFGSNTGLLKTYSLLVLVPFVLSSSEIRNRKYWLILTAVLIPFSIFTKIFGIYEDKNLLVLDEKLRLEKLSPIHTNSERARYLEQVEAAVRNLKSQGVHVYFYGDKAHIFHYLYPETSLDITSFFQPVNKPEYFQKIEKNSNHLLM